MYTYLLTVWTYIDITVVECRHIYCVPGKPHKDPSTGYMMSHGLSSTDVTKLADKTG